MAQYTTHRRRLATPEDQPPSLIASSMDPTVKKQPRNNSFHQTNQYPDSTVPSRQSYMLSPKQNPVLTKAKSLKHNKPSKCIENLLQAKSMTLSADFDASSRAQVESTHPKQQTRDKAGDSEVEKESKKPHFKDRTDREKVKVKTLHEEGKKDVYFIVKGSKAKDFKDPLGDGHLDLKRLSFGGGGRRSSFCGAQVELRDFLANNGAKIVAVDMPPFMQIHAVDCARKTHDSLEKFSSKSLALTLKKEFDGVYGPAWHCIVGTSFGSFVTHSVGGFLYFSMDQKLYVLLFKTTVQRAD